MFNEAFLKLVFIQFESFWTICQESGVPDTAKEDMLKTWLSELSKLVTTDVLS